MSCDIFQQGCTDENDYCESSAKGGGGAGTYPPGYREWFEKPSAEVKLGPDGKGFEPMGIPETEKERIRLSIGDKQGAWVEPDGVDFERSACGDGLIEILKRQKEFSEKTFGPGHRPEGLCDHIRKELDEIAAAPYTLEEWIDVVILAFDGAWRSEHSPSQIVEALIAKQKKNESRKWPDWRTAEPGKAIEHIKTEKPKESVLDTAPKNNSKEGKARASLLPMDVLMEYLVPAYEEGCLKYDRESWRKGFQTSVLIDAAQRHIGDFFYLREDWDPDAAKLGVKKHHLAGAIFSLLSILWSLKTRPELDDRPKRLVGEK